MDASSEHPADVPATVGTVVGGRYRLDQRIASGGMASVWEAHDDVLARKVAVKILHPHLAADEQFVARFRREAVSAARLAHPAIVAIYDTCSQGSTEAIVMELVRGTTLRAELDRRGRFPPNEAAHVVAEIADALVCAHAAGVVHRDVKPANVLLSRDGRVLVADFGIAKAGDGLDLTGTNTTLGTAKYLAPEQVDPGVGPVDARADVYATGVILYELLCGTPPFIADTEAGTALARLHRDPTPPRELVPDVDPQVEAVALRAMARDPADRFTTAAELRDALRGAPAAAVPSPGPPTMPVAAVDLAAVSTADGTRVAPAPTPPPMPVAPAPAPRRRRWAPLVLGTIVVVALAVAGVLWIRIGDDDPAGSGAAESSTSALDGGAPIVAVRSFDPEGDDRRENEGDTPLTVDGVADTSWRTSCYTRPDFGGLKDGVGLVLELGAGSALDELRVDSPNTGWTAEVYVAATAPADKAGWGDPIATGTGVAGTTTFRLGDVEGGALLLWFTSITESPACGENPFGVSVSELAVV